MEPITLAAAAIATLFFSEAAKEGGKSLGAGAAKMVGEVVKLVRNKFKGGGIEGLLTQAEKQPTEENINLVETVLLSQLQGDKGFADELKALLEKLEGAGVVRQVMASRLELSGDLEAKDMIQDASRGDSVEQKMLTDVKAKNINLGNMTQKS